MTSSPTLYRSPGIDGEFAPWVRGLKGKSGVYIIRKTGFMFFRAQIVYVGESHTGRFYETLTRHFMRWNGDGRGPHGNGRGAGPTYDRRKVEVAIVITPKDRAFGYQNRLIEKFRPVDNIAEKPDVPF